MSCFEGPLPPLQSSSGHSMDNSPSSTSRQDAQATPPADATYGLDPPGSSRRCNRCRLIRQQEQPLKQCRGCSVTMYCSKACQKADWPSHNRHMCKGATRFADAEGPKKAGFSTPMSLAHAVMKWAEIHEYAMSYMANAAVLLHGKGVDNTLNSACGVLYVLVPNPAPGPDSRTANDSEASNPATAFRMECFPAVVSPDTPGTSFLGTHGLLDRALARCKGVTELQRMLLPDIRNYAGVIPALFMVLNTQHVQHFYYRIYRLSIHSDCPLDPIPARVWGEIMTICREAVDAGRILKAPDYETRVQPHVGRYKRVGNKWKWERSEEEDQAMASRNIFLLCDLV
ncbi:hypothetical protein C8Q76DRAFT_465156 [Earliella scabrosa]|nr:hypothetical protein C8Q76DRAFT_465156 [Earliella scabrosa]